MPLVVSTVSNVQPEGVVYTGEPMVPTEAVMINTSPSATLAGFGTERLLTAAPVPVEAVAEPTKVGTKVTSAQPPSP
jgi:hypothetical protein